jgi:hypothetical protein
MLETNYQTVFNAIANSMEEEQVRHKVLLRGGNRNAWNNKWINWREGHKKLKNPYIPSDLKRYIWVIARLGGWKVTALKETPASPHSG